jgi:two-component system, LytTR family, response regulator
VDWLAAAENYVELHARKASHLLHVTINTPGESLDPEIFLRIHRSTMVNVKRIKALQPAAHREYLVTLQDGMRLQSGQSYLEKLRALAANPF